MEPKLVSKTRLYLTVVIVVLIAIVAVISVQIPEAIVIFDKLTPVLMLVLGYYFGRNQ